MYGCRYNNHTCSFRNKSREKNTELSKYVWELKDKDVNFSFNWDIAINMFVVHENVIYVFARNFLLQEEIHLFC